MRVNTFRPSEVVLQPPWLPLPATMQKVEAELAAALLIRALAATSDEWRPIAWHEAQKVWRADIAAGVEPTTSLLTKGIVMPDVHECINRGYVTAPVFDGRTAGPFVFTEKGLAAIAKWARAEEGTAGVL